MQLKNAYAPFFRDNTNENSLALTRIAAFALLLAGSVFASGFRAFFIALSGVLGAVCVLVAWRITENKNFIDELPCAVSLGLGCACLLPAAIDIWVPFLSAAFAMFASRLVFGAAGRNPISAEALGYCFAAVGFANLKSDYNIAMLPPEQQNIFSGGYRLLFGFSQSELPLFENITPSADFSSMLSPAASLRAGVSPNLNWVELFFFGQNAAIGTSAAILVAVCIIWLIFRKACVWRSVLCFIISAAVFSLLFPYDSVGRWLSPLYEVFTGTTLFAAVFLCGDITCAPHTRSAQYIFGIGCGILGALLRRIGSVEGCEIFAVALMCCISSSLDRFAWLFRSNGVSLHQKRDEIIKTLRIKLGLKNALGESYAELYELEQESLERRNGDEQ